MNAIRNEGATNSAVTPRVLIPARYRHARESWHAVSCCLVLLICILLAKPFANGGFDDDWSYSYTALKLAETGHLHYGGWGGSTILFQAVWGAAWIRVFGFSFDVLRAATIPFSLGFVLLVYALARRVGLRSSLALFASLTVGTSPLFLPFAASFMTEAYTCFFSVLSIYAAIASAQASARARAIGWLWILAVAGAVGGANRQVVWAAPLVLIPYLVLVRRGERRFCLHAVGLYIVCIASCAVIAYICVPPFSPLAVPFHDPGIVVPRAAFAVCAVIYLLFSCFAVTLPAFLCLVPLWRRLGVTSVILYAVLSATAVASLVVIFGLHHGLVPFLGNILSPTGILNPGEDALGPRPLIIPLVLRFGITWLLGFSILAFSRLYRSAGSHPDRVPLVVLTLFSASYVALLVPIALIGLTFDRYVLPLFPVLVLAALLPFRSCMRKAPLSAWVCLLVFAGYSVGTTHDYFSALRARVLASSKAQELGICRNHISAGLEYDGWEQLQMAGVMSPIGPGELTGNTTDRFWLWGCTKALSPDFVVSYWLSSHLPKDSIVTISFQAWLPPFKRSVVVLSRADLLRANP